MSYESKIMADLYGLMAHAIKELHANGLNSKSHVKNFVDSIKTH